MVLAACGDDGGDDGGGGTSAETAVLHTSAGDIPLELDAAAAPETVANFVGLATGEKEWTDPETGDTMTDEPFYDGTTFHRVIAGFMIQGGDPLGDGTGGPGYAIDDEIDPDLTFDHPYVLAMANAGPDTGGSQFFITVAETPHLDGGYTIFGEVTDPEGQAVVDAIAEAPTGEGDRPAEPVVIESVEVGG
ncbi:peptidylprolyl isomerase [Mumia flava]|nr:peptidylprolyl isomerase [Mumia flava]